MMETQLTAFVILYCTNTINLSMAAIASDTCFEEFVTKVYLRH